MNVETTCSSKPSMIQHCQLTGLASTERNATSSPLLRLPPEIRNHIFSLALNHGYIPITFPERSCRWRIKRAERRGFEYRYHCKQLCDLFYNPISFSSRSCSFKLKKRPIRNFKRVNHLKRPINLLFVCRQIYAETALLPYKVNTWVIELHRPWEREREGYERYYWHDTTHFLGTLTAQQRDVMDEVWCVHEFRGGQTVSMGSAEVWMERWLPRLNSSVLEMMYCEDTSMFLSP